MIKKTIPLIFSLSIVSCSVIQNMPEAENVRLVFNKEFDQAVLRVSDCRYLGNVIGSEGHWYSFIFISNSDLTEGALNDMRNDAYRMGANIVYVDGDIGFGTSVTFYGQAYHCNFKK